MEREGSDLGTTLVGMVGLDVVDVVDDDHGLWVLVETRPGRVACGACGVRAQSKGRLTTLVGDLEIAGRVATLVWRKRRWRCPDPACEARTWTDRWEGIAPRVSLTERARSEIARRIGEDAEAVARVAAAFGVAWATAWSAFEELITPAVEDPPASRPWSPWASTRRPSSERPPTTQPCGRPGWSMSATVASSM